jgi:hypothetical protein
MFARNLFPKPILKILIIILTISPAPSLAPLISPAISQISIYAGTTFSGFEASVSFLICLSYTATLATLGSIVQNG